MLRGRGRDVRRRRDGIGDLSAPALKRGRILWSRLRSRLAKVAVLALSLSLVPSPHLHPFPSFMAQVATMGPPLSPRETRRSGRRSAPSGSTSTSKSPDSPSSESAPRLPVVNRSSSSTSSRKRTKQDDPEDPPDEFHKNGSNGTPNGVPPLQNANGRTKRKGKEKEKPVLNLAIDSIIAEGEQADVVLELSGDPDVEEEEQGVTRCVCGNAGKSLLSYVLSSFPMPPNLLLGLTLRPGRDSVMSQSSRGAVPQWSPMAALNPQIILPLGTPVPDRVFPYTSITQSLSSPIHLS